MSFDPDLIKQFVQADLGCQCPEEVFNSIKYENHVHLEYGFYVDKAITIGNRLLIFVMNVTKYIEILKILDKLVTHGIAWRDGEGLNRFRLVLISEKPKELKSDVIKEFNKLTGKDKKAHLHIVSKNEMINKNYEFLEKE
jgi:hypothetical protein